MSNTDSLLSMDVTILKFQYSFLFNYCTRNWNNIAYNTPFIGFKVKCMVVVFDRWNNTLVIPTQIDLVELEICKPVLSGFRNLCSSFINNALFAWLYESFLVDLEFISFVMPREIVVIPMLRSVIFVLSFCIVSFWFVCIASLPHEMIDSDNCCK